MTLLIRKPGLFTTVQDLGRRGFADAGVPPSGAMDEGSFRAANRLVGNDDSAAGIEFTLVGPEIVFEHDAVVALTGAEFARHLEPVVVEGRSASAWKVPGWLDGRDAPMNGAFRIPAGTCLVLGQTREGARGYLAIRGGIDVPMVLGSRSTTVAARWGGHRGRTFLAKDRIPVGAGHPHAPLRRYPPELREKRGSEATLRVLPGPMDEALPPSAREMFFKTVWRVSTTSDRTGVRLEGAAIERCGFADVPPRGTLPGTIQIPGDGRPILLGPDRPVTGGYAQAGVIITADLGRLAQLKPGDEVRFVETDAERARNLWRAREDLLEAWEEIR